MSLTGTLFINEIYMQAFWLSGQDRTCAYAGVNVTITFLCAKILHRYQLLFVVIKFYFFLVNNTLSFCHVIIFL